MSEPEEVQFGCIGCGTFNPASAEVCAGCGHRFAGNDLAPKTRIVLPPRQTDNPFEPPLAPIAAVRTFRIGSLLVLIAVVAVCMGAFRSNIALGVVVSVSVIPAAIRTSILAGNRRAAGQPMPLEELLAPFLLTMVSTWAVALSSVIAFCATCVPAGLATGSLGIALVIGISAAVACGGWLTSILIRQARESARRQHEIRYR